MTIETYHPIPEEYWSAVDEVVRFITDGQLLAKPFDDNHFHDYPCHVVYEILDWTPYRVAGLPYSQCEDEWQDFRLCTENEHSRLREISAQTKPVIWSNEFNDKIGEIFLFIRPLIEHQLEAKLDHFDRVDDFLEIDLHLSLIIDSRAKIGAGHSQVNEEKLFNVYKAGGYPCGWIGPFLGGKLVVFSNDPSRSGSK